jgi:Zn-dependent membrane protease YugP
MIPGGYGGYLLIMVFGMLLSGAVGIWLRSTYSKYSKVHSYSGLTGAQTARMILDRNGLQNVRVEPVAGKLTDHYDPRSKVVRLSQDNFAGNSVAGVSVAAHEVGHAIQDATGYLPMKLRAGIFPIVNVSSQFWPMAFMIGIFAGAPFFIDLAIILFLGVLAFHLVTLPVEFDASFRANKLLKSYGILGGSEVGGTRRVLTAAAMTYVAAALTSVLTLLYLLALSRNQ